MKTSRLLLRIEELEDRTCPAPVDVGTTTGAVHFDVAGYTLFQNGAATFATTSSAFGFSEASMTKSQSVTTANGGMVQSRLNDAYDGVMTWGLPQAGGIPTSTTYVPSSGIVDITGAPVSGTPNNIHIAGPGGIITGDFTTQGSDKNSFGGLQLKQQNAVFQLDATTPVVRTIVFVTNPTNKTITQEIGSFNNLGSDSNTTLFSTSSGGATYTPGVDTWVGSFQNYSGTTSSDPRQLFAIQGPGNVATPADANSVYANGNDNPTFNFNLTIAPGQTKALMLFNVLSGSKAKLTSIGHSVFDKNKSVRAAGLLAGLSNAEISEISNWNFDLVDPTVTGVFALDVTNSSSLNSYSFTVTFADNSAIDVSTLGNNNVFVTGPNGYSQFATFVSVDMNSNGTPRTATYSITPPGGAWSVGANGLYTINMAANQVTDLEGNAVAAGPIGSFQVNLVPPPVPAPIYATGSGPGTSSQVNVYDANTQAIKYSLQPYDSSFTGGVRVAVGDVNGDGVADIVTGAGPGGGPQVRVYDGKTGQPLSGTLGSFYGIQPTSFSGGVYVAVGDVNGDGFGDVIVGADAGGGPQVEIFSGKDGALLTSFNALPTSFTGGVRVAAGDVNGDGKADIVIGAGPGGLAQVTVFSGNDLSILQSFFAIPNYTGGIFVGAGDINKDGRADIATAPGGTGATIQIFSGASSGTVLAIITDPRLAGQPAVMGLGSAGIHVALSTVSGKTALLAAPGAGTAPLVDIFDANTLGLLDSFFAFAATFRGGVFVG